MKILFVNEKLGWFGGVEQNVGDTANGLRQAGHQCFLAWGEKTARDPDRYAKQFDATGACREVGAAGGDTLATIISRFAPDVVYFHKIARVPASQDVGRPIARMVHDHDLCCPRRHKYFVHNAHVCESPAGWRCYLDLAWLEPAPGTPLGVKVHGLGGHRAEMKRNQGLDLFLVGSRFMKRELEMNGFPADRVEILPPVVCRAPSPAKPAAEKPEILYVGQLIRGKGVDLLLDALARTTALFHATIVGEGNARAALQAQATTLGLDERVTFTGWVANTDVDEYYAKARLLAVPARWPEPFGMIGLEAMHQARPVVAFATGGIPDWLEDQQNGYLIAERDVDAFAAAMDRLLGDRDLATKLGKAGWDRVHREYTFDGYIGRLVASLERIRA